MSRAHDDEWTFVLLGRDSEAPQTVRCWCAFRVAAGKNEWTDAQIVEALKWADTVEAEQLSARLEASIKRSEAGLYG